MRVWLSYKVPGKNVLIKSEAFCNKDRVDTLWARGGAEFWQNGM